MDAFRPIWRPGRPEEIDEERRLLYVAMTRARDDLRYAAAAFLIPGQPRGGDAHVFAPRSQFIAACDLDAFELIGGHFSCGAENGIDRTPRRQHRSQDQDARNMALMTLRNDP